MKKTPETFFPILIKTVFEKTGIAKSKIELVAKSYEMQIRHTDTMSVQARLIILIPLIAQEYGARHDIPKNVISECIRLIMKKFSYLALDEIREAYREWAAGELKVKGASTYGGEFNVSQMGKILTAYCNNRRSILGEFIRQRDEHESRLKEKARKERLQAKFEKEFPVLILKKREEIEDWRQVPEWWYKPIMSRGWVSFEEGEAQTIFEEAQQLAVGELKRLKEERMQENLIRRLTARLPESEDLSKSIARKLTIFRKIVLNKDWSPVAQAS